MKRKGFSENLCTYETYPSSLIFGFGIEGNEGRVRRRSETRSRWVRCSFDIWVCVDFSVNWVENRGREKEELTVVDAAASFRRRKGDEGKP